MAVISVAMFSLWGICIKYFLFIHTIRYCFVHYMSTLNNYPSFITIKVFWWQQGINKRALNMHLVCNWLRVPSLQNTALPCTGASLSHRVRSGGAGGGEDWQLKWLLYIKSWPHSYYKLPSSAIINCFTFDHIFPLVSAFLFTALLPSVLMYHGEGKPFQKLWWDYSVTLHIVQFLIKQYSHRLKSVMPVSVILIS